jgi:sortase B
LSLNPDTIGFLQVEDIPRLPVVHRANDNQYYLDHSFDNHESIGGTLFLDGSNLLVPEDASLIIYGHNMRNGTMFRPLINYENIDFLKENPLVQFDTIYLNNCYASFAVVTVSANADSDRYVNIRQFMFDEASWDQYIADMRALSVHSIPIDVSYGDRVLLLVTCEYTHNNGRFVVALRAQRENETMDELKERIQAAY